MQGDIACAYEAQYLQQSLPSSLHDAQAAQSLCAPEAVWAPWAHAAARLAIPFVPLPPTSQAQENRLARMTAHTPEDTEKGSPEAQKPSDERILFRGSGASPAGVHPYFAGYGSCVACDGGPCRRCPIAACGTLFLTVFPYSWCRVGLVRSGAAARPAHALVAARDHRGALDEGGGE